MRKAAPTTSTATKERLLEAAIKIFALYGYEGASTRQLTQEAGVNISAIPYYFKDKEGLYHATLSHIADTIQKNTGDRTQFVLTLLQRTDASPQEYKDALHDLIKLLGTFLLGDKISAYIARIFLREQMEPTNGFSLIYEKMMRPRHEALTELIAHVAHLPFPSEQATLCAHAILGQLSVFKTHREAALRRLGWKKYGMREKEKIVETVLRHTDYILDMYAQQAAPRRLS